MQKNTSLDTIISFLNILAGDSIFCKLYENTVGALVVFTSIAVVTFQILSLIENACLLPQSIHRFYFKFNTTKAPIHF